MRYEQLLDAVRERNPSTILEVGTWNGVRAQQMLNLCPNATYYGFDLFEDATAENDREEMNVKPHYYMEAVEDRLTGFDAHLIKGNTRETLPAFKPDKPIEFVWLDGGHSVDTIRSDWEAIKPHLADGAWVFFDDYYIGVEIDTTRFGCNLVVAELRHEVLPIADRVSGGGLVHMVRVYP